MSNVLRGVITNPDKIYGKSAYEIAVMHGYDGTEEEWIAEIDANRITGAEMLAYAQSARNSRDEAVLRADKARASGEYAYQCMDNANSHMLEAAVSATRAQLAAETAQEAKEKLLEEIELAAEIVQTTGDSETAVMSQKAVTNEIKSNVVALESDHATLLPNGTDFDTLLEPGNFKVQTLSQGSTMVNAPAPHAGRLIVMRTSQHGRVLQVYVANNAGGRTLFRLYDGAWSAWDEFAKGSSVTALSELVTHPSYYETMLTNKAQKINLELSALGFGGGDAFVFITDIHEKPLHTPTTMKRICRDTNITKIINNGDVAKDKDTKAEVLPLLNKYYNLYNFAGCDLYKVVGNHEFNNGGAREDYADRQLSNNELYSTIFGDNANKVTFDPTGTLAYYFDNQAAKIRYFVCSVNYKSTVDTNAIRWIVAELENVPTDYDVIVFCHHGLNSNGELTTFTPYLVNALDAYKAHRTYTYNLGDKTYDFTQKTGEVICMCVGDEHKDLNIRSTGGVPIIATTCASVDEELGTLERAEGTVSESAYDVYVINKNARKINITRIGAGSDREFTY